MGLSAHGQNLEYINYLKAELLNRNESGRVDLFYDLAWEYRNSMPDSTIVYAQKALDLARSNNLTHQVAKAYNFIGIAHHYKGEYLNSFNYLSQALEVSKNLKDSVQFGHALNTIGRLFMTQGDLVKAYNYFHEAKEVFEALNNQRGLSHFYKSMAVLYETQNNIPKALEMLESALKIREAVKDERAQISIHIELADIYVSQGNYEKAFQYYQNAMVIAEKINDDVNVAEISNGIASLYYNQGQYEKAKAYTETAKSVIEQISNEDLRTKIYLQKGMIHLAQNEVSKGKNYLLQVVDLSKLSGNKSMEMQAFYHLHNMAKAANNTSAAYDYFQGYFNLRKSLEDADIARRIERLEARLEIEKQERENEILLANQARDKALIEQQQLEIAGLFIIFLILITFIVHLWITAKTRRRDNRKLEVQKERIAIQKMEITNQNDMINAQNAKLQKRNAELAHLNDEKDNLMNIMAHDLKGPLNRIVGLVELIKMSASIGKEGEKYLSMIKEVSLGGIELIRDLLDVHAYEAERRVMNFIRIDLEKFLNKKVETFRREIEDKKLIVKTTVELHEQGFFIDEMYLSRILDNLLSNAIKFSQPATSIILSAKTDEENVIISLKDHGQGFSDEDKRLVFQKFKKLSSRPTGGESSNGLGLAIVKTLVGQLNGSIELISEKNIGSEFIIRFPLKQHVSLSLN